MQMSVDASQAAQPSSPGADTPEFGNFDSACVSYNDVAHCALAIYKEPDLARNFAGKLTKLSSKVEVNQLARRNFSAVESLKRTNLLRFKTFQLAKQFGDGTSPLSGTTRQLYWVLELIVMGPLGDRKSTRFYLLSASQSPG